MLEYRSRILRVKAASSSVPQPAKRVLTSAEQMDRPFDHVPHQIVAIDPGLQGTGLAIFVDGVLINARVVQSTLKATDENWMARADNIVNELVQQIDEYTTVLCEMMEFQGFGRSLGWTSGDMQRTTYFTGLLSGRVFPSPFYFVPVHAWKGQLPKRVVEERLAKKLGTFFTRDIKSHAWDAIGIGLWALGKF